MANKKITDLIEITSAANVDVLPIVDVSADITNKIKVENLPISTATQTALDAKQATLVSGTNIKTINSTSLLGSGDIAIAANPAGTAGQIQFSDGSAFAADSNLFWDNTNKRLGVGTSSPVASVDIHVANAGTGQLRFGNIGTASAWQIGRDNTTTGRLAFISNGLEKVSFLDNTVGIGQTAPTARLQVKGSGSTSATTSLLVQNSSGTELLKVTDSGDFYMDNGNIWRAFGYSYARLKSGVSSLFIGNGYSNFTGTTFNFGSAVPHASAHLQADSTTKGFLPPRGSNAQMLAIVSPAEGLIFYDNTNHKLNVFDGTSWVAMH